MEMVSYDRSHNVYGSYAHEHGEPKDHITLPGIDFEYLGKCEADELRIANLKDEENG